MSNVTLAASAGFCFGVKRAIEMAYAEIEKNNGAPLYSYGPLIHNKEVTRDLDEKGLHIIEDLEGVHEGTVVIRSHGVGKFLYDALEEKGMRMVDGTCPFVKKIHTIVNEAWNQGKSIIIAGDGKHPEVQGINGWCGNTAIILESPEEAKAAVLDTEKDYAVVVQTTFRQSKFDDMLAILRQKGLKMEISQTAKLLYSLLLDRSTLSQKNKWLDDEGRIYIIYPIAEIAEILDKGSTTIKGALNELDTAGLLERERGGFSAPNRLYVKVPPVPQVQFSDQLMAGSPPLIEPENRPTDGQKTDLMMVGKPSPNQTTINNLTESQTKGVSGGPSAPYGRYGNIFLSQTEYDELQAEYPDRLERFIEEMSRYLAANGKSYQNYAAALRIWAGNDKKEAPKKGIPDYSCKEGESL